MSFANHAEARQIPHVATGGVADLPSLVPIARS
jgi:hypothetical protein